MLRLRIESTGRLVKKQDFRFAYQSTGNRDALFLAAWKFNPSFADYGIVSEREGCYILDEDQCIGWVTSFIHHLFQLLLRLTNNVQSEQYVVLNSTAEKHWLLLDDGNLLMVPSLVQCSDIFPVKKYLAF